MRDILVAIDDSPASRDMLPALAAKATGAPERRLVLCHVPPSPPPSLLESPGAEDPADERAVEADLARAQTRWTREQVAAGARLLEESARVLERHGLARRRIDTSVTEPLSPHASLADVLVEVAHARGCGTIAVGRNAFPALVEALHTHTGDELRRRADGIELWIVDAG